MPIGGALRLKGGETLGGGVKKKKKKSRDKAAAKAPEEEGGAGEGAGAEGAEAEDGAEDGANGEQAEGASAQAAAAPVGKPAAKAEPSSITTKGTTYEQEFDLETARLKQGKARSTAWGSGYRKPPEILHGYDRKVTGTTASERLDMRAAGKSDKYAK